MGARLLLVIVLLSVCLEYIFTAPNPAPLLGKQQDLVQRFVEFLKEDKDFVNALEKVDWEEDHLVRNRRQATRTTVEPEDFDADKQPGFFDRAAKFVTELLQRFLKWVNSSDN